MATEQGKLGGLGGLASASPWGAVANAAAQIAATPNTSASGDIHTGERSFGGINFGLSPASIPWYAYAAIAVVAAIYFLKRK